MPVLLVSAPVLRSPPIKSRGKSPGPDLLGRHTPHKIMDVSVWLVVALSAALAAALACSRWLDARVSGSNDSWRALVAWLDSERPVAALVTAHPDDEAMFFVPAVRALQREGVRVALLCLSSGDADGLGALRRVELVRSACGVLGLDRGAVECAGALRDGMREDWPADEVARAVGAFVARHGASLIVTFDGGGVSGHPNHRHTRRGVARYLREGGAAASPSLRAALELETTSLPRKYSGPLDWFWSAAETSGTGTRFLVGDSGSAAAADAAMRAHASQYVWYRRLFVVFSRYTALNTLRMFWSRECGTLPPG